MRAHSGYYPCRLRLTPQEAVTALQLKRPTVFPLHSFIRASASAHTVYNAARTVESAEVFRLLLSCQNPPNTQSCILRSDRLNMARTLGLLASCLLFLLSSGAEGKRSRERVYYVGIIEDAWDYAPSGKNLLNGEDVADDE